MAGRRNEVQEINGRVVRQTTYLLAERQNHDSEYKIGRGIKPYRVRKVSNSLLRSKRLRKTTLRVSWGGPSHRLAPWFS